MERRTAVSAKVSPRVPADPAAPGTRPTILFTDVEGSTELLAREGDTRASRILQRHEELVRERIGASGGREVAFTGDGFLAVFPTAESGIDCAVWIQEALARRNREDPEHPLRVRIGLHSGEVMERGGQLYGQAVHAAARVMAEAAGGEILVSEAVRSALPDGRAQLVDRGLFWLKGLPKPWRLYQVVPAGAEARDSVSVPGGSAPFVERDVERAELRRGLGSARSGEGRFVLLGGEAGIGKSRLLGEVSAEADSRGMGTLVGHCAEEGGGPYLPIVEILERALLDPRSPRTLQEALGDQGAELARLVPELRRAHPELPQALDLPAEQARRYLWWSVAEFLRRAAQLRPLLIVVEDLHWADEPTIQFLAYLAPLLPTMPLMVAGTYRDTEVGLSHPLSRTIHQLARRRLVQRISLGALGEDGVARMIEGLAGHPPPAGLVRAIRSVTEGNPFFVEEVFLHLLESGALVDEEGRFRSDLRIEELDVPESVRVALDGRLRRLSPATRDLLRAAAVSGRVFDSEVVARVVGLAPDELAAAFEEAEAARLIASGGTRDDRAAFLHELIRQTLLAEVSSVKRRQLHARTADALEAVHADRIREWAEDMVHHLGRAGHGVDPARLARHLRAAGERALEISAYEEAVGRFERALSLVPEAAREDRALVLERLALAQRNLGRWTHALRTMDQALQLYQELGDGAAVGRLCWAVAYQLTWTARFEDAVSVAARGLEAMGNVAHNPDRPRLLSLTGWVTGLAGDHAGASALFDSARSLAEALGNRRVLADVLHMETAHSMTYAEFSRGVQVGRRGAAVFEEEGALWDLCSVLGFVQFQLGTMLRQEEAAELAARVYPMADRLGHLGAKFLVLADRVRREGVMASDLQTTRALAREEIEVCRQGSLPWLYTGYLYLGFAAHWDGRWEEAENHLRTALELEPPGALAGQAAAHLALHLAELGGVSEVTDLFESVKATLPDGTGAPSLGQWNTLFGFAEALYLVGRKGEVAKMHPTAGRALALDDWIAFDCRLVRARAGVMAAAAERWEEADRYFESALATAEAIGHRIEQADVRRLRARMLADRGAAGDVDVATRLHREAIAIYRDLGMERKAEQVAAEWTTQ